MTLDENDLRAGLRALTAFVPPAPPDRASSSMRRVRTLRYRRTGVAVATAFALALPVAAVVTRDSAPEPAGPLATALLEWPERVDPGTRERAEAAIEYEALRDPQVATIEARLLYGGDVAGTYVAVWARCAEGTCRHLTLAYETPGDERQDWGLLNNGFLDPSLPDKPIGWYLRTPTGSTLFALGPPGARRLTTSDIDDPLDLHSKNGVFIAGIGQRTSHLEVSIANGRGDTILAGRLGLPGVEPLDAVPNAGPAFPITSIPAGYRLGPVYTGQGGDYLRGEYDAGDGEHYRVFARCSGKADLDLITGTSISGSVPCDGEVHAGPLDKTGRPGAGVYASSEDPFTLFSVAIGFVE